ncbi:hypothetical protein GCM10027290_33620 [Micromonospora sonneratiae]
MAAGASRFPGRLQARPGFGFDFDFDFGFGFVTVHRSGGHPHPANPKQWAQHHGTLPNACSPRSWSLGRWVAVCRRTGPTSKKRA